MLNGLNVSTLDEEHIGSLQFCTLRSLLGPHLLIVSARRESHVPNLPLLLEYFVCNQKGLNDAL